MSRLLTCTLTLGVMAVLAACSIPKSEFRATPDGGGSGSGDAMSSVLAIRPSVASFDVDEGSTTDFTIKLSQAPSAELVVKVVPADAASANAIGISAPELRFEPTNFDQPQSITVTGLVDADAVDALASITLSADGVDPVTVSATVRDHDKVEIATDIAGSILTINETKTSAVHVHLTHQPASDVRVTVVLGTGPVTVSPAQCTFTAANYDVDQTFTFSAPDDINIVSEDEALTFQATGSPDVLYTIHDVDKDTLNINATPTSLSVNEGSSAQVSVTLTKQPAANTTVHIALQTGNVTIDHTDLTFTPQNFDQTQVVTVSAPQDQNTTNESDQLTLSIPAQPSVGSVSISVRTIDDDTQAIVEDAPDPLSVTENQTATFGVTLKFQPASNITVAVSSLNNAIATASPGTLTFTPQNYNDPTMHQVTVHGTDDNNLVTNSTSIKLSEATLVDKLVPVDVADDDTQQFVVSTTSLMIPEGMTRTFDVSLKFDPGTTVTVTLANNDATSLPSSPSSITFTGGPSGNWPTPVHVTVSPPVDTNNVAETAVITVHGAGAPDVAVMATVTDSTVVAQYGFPPVPAPFTGSVTLSAGTVLAYKVPVSTTTTLDSFGVFVKGTVGDFRMAIYADAGGFPGARVAFMPQRQAIAVGTGINIGNLVPDSLDPTITVGTYWVALRVAQPTALSQDQDPSVTGNDCVTNITIPSLDSDWPDPFVPATTLPQCRTDKLVNFWINTYHQ